MEYSPFIMLAIALSIFVTRLPAIRKARARGKQMQAFISSMGFHALKKQPKEFPLQSFPMAQASIKGVRTFANAAITNCGGRKVLFFDYTLTANNGLMKTLLVGQTNRAVPVVNTVVAVRGGSECFPAAKSDPTLHLETVGGWTIAYWEKRVLAGQEIQALVSAIPAKA